MVGEAVAWLLYTYTRSNADARGLAGQTPGMVNEHLNSDQMNHRG